MNNNNTKNLFLKYESIRQSGQYNMFTEGFQVMKEMKLNPRHASDRNIYYDIIHNYSIYAKEWL